MFPIPILIFTPCLCLLCFPSLALVFALRVEIISIVIQLLYIPWAVNLAQKKIQLDKVMIICRASPGGFFKLSKLVLIASLSCLRPYRSRQGRKDLIMSINASFIDVTLTWDCIFCVYFTPVLPAGGCTLVK